MRIEVTIAEEAAASASASAAAAVATARAVGAPKFGRAWERLDGFANAVGSLRFRRTQ